MGCSSSDLDYSNPGPPPNRLQLANHGRGVTESIKIKYFPLYGRADPLT